MVHEAFMTSSLLSFAASLAARPLYLLDCWINSEPAWSSRAAEPPSVPYSSYMPSPVFSVQPSLTLHDHMLLLGKISSLQPPDLPESSNSPIVPSILIHSLLKEVSLTVSCIHATDFPTCLNDMGPCF